MTTDEELGWVPLEGNPSISCLNCGSKPKILSLNYSPHPYVGMVGLYQDSEFIEELSCDWDRDDIEELHVRQLHDWNMLAIQMPYYTWDIDIHGPFRGLRYTFTDGEWVATAEREME